MNPRIIWAFFFFLPIGTFCSYRKETLSVSQGREIFKEFCILIEMRRQKSKLWGKVAEMYEAEYQSRDCFTKNDCQTLQTSPLKNLAYCSQ